MHILMPKKLKKYISKVFEFFCRYYMFIFLFAFLLLLHLTSPHLEDDLIFSKYLKERSLKDFIVWRYNTWTSRNIIEVIVVMFCTGRHWKVWSFIDTLIYVIMTIIISKMFNKKHNKRFDTVLCLLVLIYSFQDMGSAGTTVTTLNYILPLTCLLYSMFILSKTNNVEKIHKLEYVAATVTSLIACNVEQTCLVFVGFTIIDVIFLIIKRRLSNRNWFVVFLMIIGIMELLYIIKCPGNLTRYESEINTWYPEYRYYGIDCKLYLGIVSTTSVILNQKVVFTIFALLLMIYTFIKSQNKVMRIVSTLDFSFFMFMGTLKETSKTIFSSLNTFYDIVDINGIYYTGSHLPNIICLFIILFVAFSMIYLIYKLLDCKIVYPLIFLAGLLSRIVMGFSPTVFASRSRTAIILYFSAIILSYVLYMKIVERLEGDKNGPEMNKNSGVNKGIDWNDNSKDKEISYIKFENKSLAECRKRNELLINVINYVILISAIWEYLDTLFANVGNLLSI